MSGGFGAARRGDAQAHGGAIITGSPNVLTAKMPQARAGVDFTACPVPLPPHGVNPILLGSATVAVNGKPAARQLDLSVCGAPIATCATTVLIGGPPAPIAPVIPPPVAPPPAPLVATLAMATALCAAQPPPVVAANFGASL
jgi:uncharacterized Zn-binding protein involved in type VI secretion